MKLDEPKSAFLRSDCMLRRSIEIRLLISLGAQLRNITEYISCVWSNSLPCCLHVLEALNVTIPMTSVFAVPEVTEAGYTCCAKVIGLRAVCAWCSM